jgi:WhiB family redox-sensing transcriptional regulator
LLEFAIALGAEFQEQRWREAAACRGDPPERWHPPRGAAIAPLRHVCERCPVRCECLDFALRSGEKIGVWGGTSERERRRIRRRGIGAAEALAEVDAGAGGRRRRRP